MCMYLFLVYLQSMTASTSVTDSVYHLIIQSYQPALTSQSFTLHPLGVLWKLG